jgi:hypothetical protein
LIELRREGAHKPKVGGSNPPPATTAASDARSRADDLARSALASLNWLL